MKNRHIGASFDGFLQEEGLLAAAEATAVKRIITYQIEEEMEARNISKSAPYFHNGSVNNLTEAVKIMAKSQLNQELSNKDVNDIVAFLGHSFKAFS